MGKNDYRERREVEEVMNTLRTRFTKALEDSSEPVPNPEMQIFQYRELNEAHSNLADCARWAIRFGDYFDEIRVGNIKNLLDKGALVLSRTPYKERATKRPDEFIERIKLNREAGHQDLERVA